MYVIGAVGTGVGATLWTWPWAEPETGRPESRRIYCLRRMIRFLAPLALLGVVISTLLLPGRLGTDDEAQFLWVEPAAQVVPARETVPPPPGDVTEPDPHEVQGPATAEVGTAAAGGTAGVDATGATPSPRQHTDETGSPPPEGDTGEGPATSIAPSVNGSDAGDGSQPDASGEPPLPQPSDGPAPSPTTEPAGVEVAPVDEPPAASEPAGIEVGAVDEPPAALEPAGVEVGAVDEPPAAPESGGVDATPIDVPAEPAFQVPELRGGASGELGSGASTLVGALDSLVARAPTGGCLVVRRAGSPVFGRNGEAPLIPASLQKLVLAEAALRVLGPDYTFTTVALAQAEPVGGVLEGDLYLVGGGDPLLSSPLFVEVLARHGALGTPLADLAADLVAAGLTRITGGVVAVEDRYDTLRDVPDWPARFASQSVAGSLSAVAVDQGWRAPPGIISTWGLLPHPAPAQRAAEAFDDLLEARSVRIPQVPRVAPAGGDYSDHLVLAAIESAPLVAHLHYLLAESDNTLAEMLMKELGLVTRGSGTTHAGAQAVRAALVGEVPGLGVPADGSGLSPQNRLSCNLVTDVLELGGPDGYLGSNLALAGHSGTMENRYRHSPVAGLVRGKTGSLDGVATLAGFAEAAAGEPFSFAVILNSGEEWIDEASAFAFFADLLEILVGAS